MAIVPIEVATDGFMGTGNKPLSIAVRGLLLAGLVEAVTGLFKPLFGPLFEPLHDGLEPLPWEKEEHKRDRGSA